MGGFWSTITPNFRKYSIEPEFTTVPLLKMRNFIFGTHHFGGEYKTVPGDGEVYARIPYNQHGSKASAFLRTGKLVQKMQPKLIKDCRTIQQIIAQASKI